MTVRKYAENAVISMIGAAYDPNQPRDRTGKWTDAGRGEALSGVDEDRPATEEQLRAADDEALARWKAADSVAAGINDAIDGGDYVGALKAVDRLVEAAEAGAAADERFVDLRGGDRYEREPSEIQTVKQATGSYEFAKREEADEVKELREKLEKLGGYDADLARRMAEFSKAKVKDVLREYQSRRNAYIDMVEAKKAKAGGVRARWRHKSLDWRGKTKAEKLQEKRDRQDAEDMANP